MSETQAALDPFGCGFIHTDVNATFSALVSDPNLKYLCLTSIKVKRGINAFKGGRALTSDVTLGLVELHFSLLLVDGLFQRLIL